MRGDAHVVAGLQIARRLAFEAQRGGAAEQDHPFGLRLIEPLARRRRLAGRDDALDAQAGRAQERGELLRREPRRDVGKDVRERGHSLTPVGAAEPQPRALGG